jgi:anti-sigma factor RsiW
MTVERISEEDRELDRALAELPEPELSAELRGRLAEIPERAKVRRFPVRSWRASALGWAAAAAIGLFIGAQTADTEPADTASVDSEAIDNGSLEEDETLALAVGSFTELEEEP